MKKANKKSYSKCKKFLATVLMAAMIMSTAVTGAGYIGGGNITVNAVSEEEKTSGDFTYCEQEDGTVKVLRYNANAENNGGKVEIPSEIDGKKLTSVAYGAFASYISEEEVDNREDITSISFPATIKDMPGFDYCPNLTDITVDEGNEYYSSENGVLFNKDKTTLIRVPINSSITDYQIPDSVTTLSGSVFSLCKNLTSVKMPDSVTKIEDGSWFSLFLHCKKLKEVTLSKNITAIGDMMFYGCSSLQSINIPENVESIGDLAFSGCSALKSIDVDKNNAVYSSQDGVLFDKDKTKLIKFPAKSDKSEYNIPDSVTVIGDKAFEYCETLTSITMPDSVSSLDGNDSSTFIGCDKLTDVKLSNNIPVITGRMFYGCSSLKNIKIPDSITRIYYEAFNDCTSLEIIDVPDSVTSIDGKDVYENTLWYKNQPDGVVYLGKVACAFKGEMLADTTIVLKDGTVGISDDFFFGTDNKITSIVIPDSIKYLDEGAFFWFNGKTIYGIKGSLAENIAYLCDKTFKAVEISEKTFTDEKTNITVKSRVIGNTALYVEQDYNTLVENTVSDYHISLKSNGKDINLYDDITVSIPCDNPDCKVLAVKDWETQTDMNATYENGVYTFKTNHLPAEFAVVLKTTEDNSEPEQSSENEPSKTTENSSAQQTSENKGTTDTSNTGISDTSASDLPTTADSVLPAVIVALLAAISGITAVIFSKRKKSER